MSPIYIPDGTLTVRTEIFRGFPQSVRANAGIVSEASHDGFPQNYFRFITHQGFIFLRFEVERFVMYIYL
jgi:hypothetical protein